MGRLNPRPAPQYPEGHYFLLSGTSAATLGGLTAIPGPRNFEAARPRIAAASASRVLVGWSVNGLDPVEQGIWTTWRTYPTAGRATFSKPERRTRSAYDVLDGLATDAIGHGYLLLHRFYSR